MTPGSGARSLQRHKAWGQAWHLLGPLEVTGDIGVGSLFGPSEAQCELLPAAALGSLEEADRAAGTATQSALGSLAFPEGSQPCARNSHQSLSVPSITAGQMPCALRVSRDKQPRQQAGRRGGGSRTKRKHSQAKCSLGVCT